ncbi:winged helix-turn-helix transcriptional regulator [Candidatus Bathyarchaeota archaeon]|nr:winged helix-turn-helix transcriptional regulator [Candidatus Bathyarchaeota archaeon]
MKESFHPKARLTKRRNIRTGLSTRTKILIALEKGEKHAKEVAVLANVSYHTVIHHLRLLEDEKIARRKGERKPFLWELTGVGQQRLI